MAEQAQERSGKRLIRVAQLLLLLAAVGLWAASRLTWVQLDLEDGLSPPKTVTLAGSQWSTALVPVALLLAAAAVAALAVRGWPLRLLAGLLALVSAATAYLGVSQWVVADVAVRAADLAQVPVMWLVGSRRFYTGAAITVAVAVAILLAAVLLMRSAATGKAATTRYLAPGARRSQVREEAATVEPSPTGETPDPMTERMMWDALDEGQDPTQRPSEAEGAPKEEGR